MSRFSILQLGVAGLFAFTSHLVTASPLPTPSVTIGQGSAISCPASDSQTVTIGADSFYIACGSDYYGGDLSLSWETSFPNCITTCESTAGCIAVSYDGGACYMKSSLAGLQANPNISAAKKVVASSPASTPTPSAASCPSADGATYTAKDGSIFKIECSSDRYGKDLAIEWVSDLNGCIEACATTLGCVDVSYRPGTPGPCYMKKSFEQAVRTDAGVWGALKIGTASSTSSTSSTTSSAASSASSSTNAITTSSAFSSSTPPASSSASTPTPSATPKANTCGWIPNANFDQVGTVSNWHTISVQSTGTLPSNSAHFAVSDYNGLYVNGTNVGVIYLYSPTDSVTWGTTIQALAAGKTYSVTFWAVMAPNAITRVTVDGGQQWTLPVSDGSPTGTRYAFQFTAQSEQAVLQVQSSSTGGGRHIFDDFTIAPSDGVCP